VDRTSRAETVLRAIMGDKFRRALLAFPDEDVLVGTRLLGPEGFRAFAGLTDVVPGPDHKATGEERAWGRRLAKRFGADGRIDDRTFVVSGDGNEAGGFDFASPKAQPDAVTAGFFASVEVGSGGRLVTFGWAMAEDLAAGKLGGH
jgi:hypothetical protein